MSSIRDRAVMLTETIRDFHHTGSVTPSSRYLARALTAPIRKLAAHSGPISVLEAGAGTGAVTHRILEALRPGDRLVAYELNPRMARLLATKIAATAKIRGVDFEIRQEPVQQAQINDELFEVVVSGLPLNNFTPEQVHEIFNTFFGVVKPGGHITFFEYIGIRRVRSTLAIGKSRRRYAGIDNVVKTHINRHAVHQRGVLLNFPPAMAHTLQAPGIA